VMSNCWSVLHFGATIFHDQTQNQQNWQQMLQQNLTPELISRPNLQAASYTMI